MPNGRRVGEMGETGEGIKNKLVGREQPCGYEV